MAKLDVADCSWKIDAAERHAAAKEPRRQTDDAKHSAAGCVSEVVLYEYDGSKLNLTGSGYVNIGDCSRR